MKEIYLDIKGYEGKYQVSNLGNIRNAKTGRILAQRKNHRGYMLIQLCKNGEQKTHLVHRLVLSTFKPNSNNKLQVNHIDECKTNNTVGNLEWCTCKENNNYGSHNERMAATHKVNGTYEKLSDKLSIPVYCITNDTVYKSAYEAARQLKLNQCNITACCKSRRKSTGGYQFKYYTNKEVE